MGERYELPWTGERYIPHEGGPVIAYEHVHRYVLAAQLADGGRVLDLASGEGYGSAILAAHAGSVLGVDIDAAAVEHAAHTYGRDGLEFAEADICEPNVDLGTFDLVVCFEAIEHVATPERVVDAAQVALAPGGVFIVSTPNKKVYSDDRAFHNEYHEHEFFQDEFDELLRARFPHVTMLGQHVAGASLAWPLDPARSSSTVVMDPDEGMGANGIRDGLFEPMYFIAVCSGDPIDDRVLRTSVHLDPDADLVAIYEDAARRIGELEVERTELQAYTSALMDEKDRLAKAVADQAHEAKLLRADRASSVAELAALRKTLSWRVTAPVRTLRGAARRRNPKPRSS